MTNRLISCFSTALRLLILVLVTCASLHATEVPLLGDTYVSSTNSGANYGSGQNLAIGNSNTALVRFDLSSLPVGVKPGEIARATLILFVNHVDHVGAVSVSSVLSGWAESTVTYATKPKTGAEIASFITPQGDEYVAIEITATAQEWISAPASNLGLALASSSASLLIDSKENSNTSHPARLEITVTSMGPQGPPGPRGPAGGAGGVQSITAISKMGSAGGVSVIGSKSAPEIVVTFPPAGLTKAQAVTAAQQAVAYGSGIAGRLIVTSDEDWTTGMPADANGGILQYTSITVDAGATLKIPSGLTFMATGTVDIEGTIVVQAFNWYTAVPVVSGKCSPPSASYCYLASPSLMLSSLLYPGPGGGVGGMGGYAGMGGGSLVIRAASTITIGGAGAILADGSAANTPQPSTGCGYPGSGGGSGGVLILGSQTEIFSLNLISARGGSGSDGELISLPNCGQQYGYGGGGGGSGGLVHLFAPVITSGTVTLAGGTPGSSVGNPSAGTNAEVPGAGGGALGGNGGQGGLGTTAATAGSSGQLFQTKINPTALFNH